VYYVSRTTSTSSVKNVFTESYIASISRFT
jgi:hypothetical protein